MPVGFISATRVHSRLNVKDSLKRLLTVITVFMHTAPGFNPGQIKNLKQAVITVTDRFQATSDPSNLSFSQYTIELKQKAHHHFHREKR